MSEPFFSYSFSFAGAQEETLVLSQALQLPLIFRSPLTMAPLRTGFTVSLGRKSFILDIFTETYSLIFTAAIAQALEWSLPSIQPLGRPTTPTKPGLWGRPSLPLAVRRQEHPIVPAYSSPFREL